MLSYIVSHIVDCICIVTPSFYRSTARLQTTTPRMHGGGYTPILGGSTPSWGNHPRDVLTSTEARSTRCAAANKRNICPYTTIYIYI